MHSITPSEAAFNASLNELCQRETPSQPHPDTALAEQALESTRLAIARWTGGIHLPQMLVPGMIRVSPQARWYAQANNGFQEWLSQGGFDQAADAPQRGETALPRPRNSGANNADACID